MHPEPLALRIAMVGKGSIFDRITILDQGGEQIAVQAQG